MGNQVHPKSADGEVVWEYLADEMMCLQHTNKVIVSRLERIASCLEAIGRSLGVATLQTEHSSLNQDDAESSEDAVQSGLGD